MIVDFGLSAMNERDVGIIPGYRTLAKLAKIKNVDKICREFTQIAPEAVKAHSVNSRSDLYSFGKVIENVADVLPAQKGLPELVKSMRSKAVKARPKWDEVSQNLVTLRAECGKEEKEKSSALCTLMDQIEVNEEPPMLLAEDSNNKEDSNKKGDSNKRSSFRPSFRPSTADRGG